MLKRILTLLLCAVVLFAALPVTASAASDGEKQRICDQIRSIYWKTYYSAGGNLRGYCGTMAGYELYYLGITDIPITQNGNDMYNILSTSDHVNEGFRPQLYPATAYTIEEALNTITACGTKDAYNIMAGFHWTTTAAGSRYGHVTVIHAVLDGMVYFTEGFTTPFNVDPSQPMICTIEEFAQYYDSWTGFEGMIHFGRDVEVEGCETYACNRFVRVEEETALQSLPGQANTVDLRTAPVGERLRAVAICKDTEGKLFYQILDEGELCYLPVDVAEPVLDAYNDLTVMDVELPEHMNPGDDFRLTGMIRSQYNRIDRFVAQVTDENGQVVIHCEVDKNGNMIDLSSRMINSKIDISQLPEGSYTYSLYCDMLGHTILNGTVVGQVQRVCAASSDFAVGSLAEQKKAKTAAQIPEAEKNGWQYEDGNWYYYENNEPRTGWFCDGGVDYYLLSNGAAATGWELINGQYRYFSETGAMRTGWVVNGGSRYFMLSNGAPAKGMKEIDGALYYFSESGALVTDTTVSHDGKVFVLNSDGIATEE